MENSSASKPETSAADGVRDRRKLPGIEVDLHVDEFTAVELQGLKLFSWLVYPVATVAKLSDRIMGSDCSESLGYGNFEGFQQALVAHSSSFTMDQALESGSGPGALLGASQRTL
jgi:hypothetical protein